MTYSHGTTSNGAVVYKDKWVFSHHGSDPAQEQLVNAYDLARIHKFGDEDKTVEKDATLKDLPSTRKMTAFLRDNKYYRQAQVDSRYDLEEMLSDDDVEYQIGEHVEKRETLLDGLDVDEQREIDNDIAELIGTPVDTQWSKRKDRQRSRRNWMPRPPKKWIPKTLELTDDGFIKVTMPNIAHIILFDPRFYNKVAYNDFSKNVVMVGDFKSKMELIPDFKCEDKENGDPWQEINDMIVRTIIETAAGSGLAGYGIKVGKEMVNNAVQIAAYRNTFHPILEYLDGLRDRKPIGDPDLIERLFINYYGCPDTVYYRELSRLILIASVARVEEPGCKFDYAIIVEGAQGTGKSSSITALYGNQYFGEIDVELGNLQKTAEQIMGKWALELPELSAMHKSKANDAKAFMSRQQDDVRMVYERRKSIFPRQCVIWGTTNDHKYLRDATGGRRYLIVDAGEGFIDCPGIARDRDALWQAAAAGYDAMRAEDQHGMLPLFLQGEAADEAKLLQERARRTETWETWHEKVLDWMDEEHTLLAFVNELEGVDLGGSLDETRKGIHRGAIVCRVALTMDDALQGALGQHNAAPSGVQPDMIWQKVKTELQDRGWEHGKCRIAGKLSRWLVRPDITKTERKMGFRILKPEQPPGIGYSQVADGDEFDDLI